MLKFNRSKKRLVIPVGINPNYGIDIADLYNTTDADVVANDVIEGKIAYGKDGKIVGTLDVQSEKEESYQEGYEFGYDEGNNAGYQLGYDEGKDDGIAEQKSKLESITITENGSYSREDGYNEVVVEVPDLNGDYNEGYNAGMERGYTDGYNLGSEDGYAAGRNEIINEQSDANIVASDVIEGKIGYSNNNTKIIGSLDIQSIKDASYNQGYNIGYDAGEDAGIEIGKIEIINGMNDATITAGTVFKGEIGYGKDGERIVGDFEYVEGFNFRKIGYNTEENNEVNASISDDIEYSKIFYDRWNAESLPIISNYFRNNKTLKYVPNINLDKHSTNTNMESAFSGCSNIIYVPLLNTSKITNMKYSFQNCSNLTSVPLFNTSNVTNMDSMFDGCSKITTVPLFDTSKVTNMTRMFYSCSNLKSVPLFNTSKVTNTSYMFAFDSNFSGAAPNFDLSSATNVRNMFMLCSKITSVPQYDLPNVVTLGPFLYGCSGLTSVPDFNTSKATNYSETFNGCSNVVSIGLLDMSSATEVYDTFENCGKLENIAGVTNCGKGFTGTSPYHTLSFSSSSKLTKQSCLNIFNTIYDMTQTSVIDAKITLHATTKALLSADDIAIATSKGWTIA